MYDDDPFDDCEFPATASDLMESLGDRRLELPNGTELVARAVDRGGGDYFETREDATDALYNGVGAAAIGRRGYSDRDPTTPGTDGPAPLSF